MRGLTVAVFALCFAVVARHDLAIAHDPDATLIRPEIRVTTSGGRLGVRGVIRVLRPTDMDRSLVVRLTIVRPEDGELIRSATLARIDYRRDHPRDVAYRIAEDLAIDATGLDVRIVAVDLDDGREFASVSFVRPMAPMARAVPDPGDRPDPATLHWCLEVGGWWRRYPDHVVPSGPSLASFVRDTCPARGVARLSVCDWAIDRETGAAIERMWATTDVDEIEP